MPALAQVSVEGAWARATPPRAKLAAGYLTILNRSAQPERLVGASSPAAASIEFHVHLKEGQILRMRQVNELRVPANGSFELKPGGAHLMFVDIRQPLRQGEKVPVTLEFERAGELKVELRVGAAPEPAGHRKH